MDKTKIIRTKSDKTIIRRILNNPLTTKDIWKNVCILGDFCYITNGMQMIKCSLSLIDLLDTNIKMVNVEDMNDKDKENVTELITFCNEFVTKKVDKNLYRINKSLLQVAIKATSKQIKNINLEGNEKKAPISVMFFKTAVKAKYLLELMQIHKSKFVNVYVNDEKPLMPIIIGNEEDGIVSILAPLRKDYESKRIDVRELI